MKKTMFTMMLLLAMGGSIVAQTFQSETFFHQEPEQKLNLNTLKLNSMPAESRQVMASGENETEVNVKWIDRIFNLPDYMRTFYQTYGEKVQEVLNGGSNWLSDPTLGTYNASSNNYQVAMKTFEGNISFNYPEGASGDVIRECAANAVNEACSSRNTELNTFMTFLCLSLNYDYPEAFWANSYYAWSSNWSYTFSYSHTGTTGQINYTQNMLFTLKSNDFDHRRTEFQSPQVLSQAVDEYNNRVNSILSNCPTSNLPYYKISYLNDWLTKHNSYNSIVGNGGEASTIAWSAMSALRGTTGNIGPVCEGYARAFKILCDKLNIPCVLAVGFASSTPNSTAESHMWNEVKMEDGKWYAVDVTWNDPFDKQNRPVSGYETTKWLLLGSDDIVSTNFTFAESHPFSITWDVDPNKESQWNYQLASFITNHHYNVPSAISNMPTTNVNANNHMYTLDGKHLGSGTYMPARHGRKQLIIRGDKIILW